METEFIDRQRLRAYLLGALTEDEQDRVAERYFTDDALFVQLMEVENDLLDQLVRGRLSAKDRSGFESYLKNLPDGQDRVAVARALAEVAGEEQAAAREQETPGFLPAAEPSGWWEWLPGFLTQPVPALISVAGLIVLAGLLWWFNRYQQLNRAHQELLAEAQQRQTRQEKLQQDVRDRDQQLTAEQKRVEQLEQKLEQREKQLREAQAVAGGQFAPATTVPWILSPTGLRGLNDPPAPPEEVGLGKNAKTVELKFPIREKARYVGYRVLLQTFDGKRTLWMEDLPAQPPERDGRYVVIRRPARQFTNAAYKLTLTLYKAGGDETTRDYYFTVVKR
jgi:hypothetical protein